MSQQTLWRTYEEVAQYLLGQIAEHFGLGRVEGKQIVAGASGACWEIDAKGVGKDDKGFVIIECRRYTKQGVPQEQVGGLAFRIQDSGAVGGIIVSPLPLQSGAKIIAESEGIHAVQLSADSTTSDFVLRFLEPTLHGVSIKLAAESNLRVDTKVIRAAGVMTLDMGHSETKRHYRLHDDGRRFCLGAFHEHRRLTARRALVELGLKPPTDNRG